MRVHGVHFRPGGVAAVAQLQRSLHDEEWPTSRPLRVRAIDMTCQSNREVFGRAMQDSLPSGSASTSQDSWPV